MKKDPVLHHGHFARVRNRVMRSSPDEIDDVLFMEVVVQAVFLRTDSNELAKRILNKYKTLDNLVADATVTGLKQIEGIGQNSAEKIMSILRLLEIYRQRNTPNSIRIDSEHYGDILKILDNYFKHQEQERLALFLINYQGNLTHHKIISQGANSSVNINFSEIISLAKRYDTPYIALAHNHPDGSIFPSTEDLAVTQRLFFALKQADIQLLDHIIYANNGDLFSFANMGIILEFEHKFKSTQDTKRINFN